MRTLAYVAGTPDDTTPGAHGRGDVDVVVDHASFDDRVVTHADVGAEHAVIPFSSTSCPMRQLSPMRAGPRIGRRGVDLRTLAEPDVRPEREARDLHLHLAVEDVGMGTQVGLQGADVLPVAADRRSRNMGRPASSMAGKTSEEKSTARSRGDPVEDLRLEHVDAGVDRVAEDVTPAGLLQEALDAPLGVDDDDAELERVLYRLEGEGDDGTLLGRGSRRGR